MLWPESQTEVDSNSSSQGRSNGRFRWVASVESSGGRLQLEQPEQTTLVRKL